MTCEASKRGLSILNSGRPHSPLNNEKLTNLVNVILLSSKDPISQSQKIIRKNMSFSNGLEGDIIPCLASHTWHEADPIHSKKESFYSNFSWPETMPLDKTANDLTNARDMLKLLEQHGVANATTRFRHDIIVRHRGDGKYTITMTKELLTAIGIPEITLHGTLKGLPSVSIGTAGAETVILDARDSFQEIRAARAARR